jgi:hypothetical protein
MATATESEETVRRIATGPNGCTQAATTRTKPSHTGNRANLAAKFCGSAAVLTERALIFQYTTSATQQATMRILVGIEPMVSPERVARQLPDQMSRDGIADDRGDS